MREGSAATIQKLAEKAFRHTAPSNLLRKLEPADRAIVCAYLAVFSRADGTVFDRVMDVATKTAAKGARLADELERNVFQSEAADVLEPFVGPFSFVVLLLRALNEALSLAGKPGQQGNVMKNLMLVAASEFVNHRLGGFHDEDLAELLQAVNRRGRNLDGGSISKNRNRLKREYPIVYASAKAMGTGENLKELEIPVFEFALARALKRSRGHR